MSVIFALAADAWWDGREDEAQEGTCLVLLQRDLDGIIVDLEEHVAFEERQVRTGLTAYRALSSSPVSDREATSGALQQLMVRRTLVPRDGTYRDLISTGNLRLIDDPEFRNRIVDYFEVVRARFEIINKNNAVFVDELYDGTIMRQGLIIPRATGSNLEELSPVESMLAEELRGGFVDEPDRLWRLPDDGPEWAALQAVLLMRIRIAASHALIAEELLERTRELHGAAGPAGTR